MHEEIHVRLTEIFGLVRMISEDLRAVADRLIIIESCKNSIQPIDSKIERIDLEINNITKNIESVKEFIGFA
jgi:archaellum component FlaC